MDSESVISLSSTSSKASPSDSFASVVSVSSESQRVPVSWESAGKKNKNGILEKEESVDNLQKVNEWMKTCKNNNEPEEEEDENITTTCIRYDFDKNTRVESNMPKSCYTRTRPLFSYMEEARKNAINKTKNGAHKNNGDNKDVSSAEKRSKKAKAAERKRLEDELRQKDVNKVLEDPEEFKKYVDVVAFPTLKSAKELNMKVHVRLKRKEAPNKYMPLPAKRVYEETEDFEECMREMIEEAAKKTVHANGSMKKKQQRKKKMENRRKFKFGLKKFKKGKLHKGAKRMRSLRSKGYLRNISLDTLILRKSHLRKKTAVQQRRLFREKTQEEEAKPIKIESPRCEIISVHTNSDDENIDLKNFVDDMLELDKMSEEHRKNVIESRILTSSSITNLINKQAAQEEDVQRALKIFSELSNETKKCSEEKENHAEEKENIAEPEIEENDSRTDDSQNTQTEESCTSRSLVADLIFTEHDYADFTATEQHVHRSEEEEEEDEEDEDCLTPVPIPDLEVLPVNRGIEIKSLHRSLMLTTKHKLYTNNYGLHSWNTGSKSDNKKLNHSISVSRKNGPILRAFYQDFNLVVIQENSVSFWTQSALGNVLGAQNMWIPKGQSQRIPLNSTYVQKAAREMVISTETSVAYVELWTKEHKSDVREVPVADVFATVYFWRVRQNGLDKKALQLENIKGFADDVQYCVLRCYPRIIVSWHSVQGGEKKTKIHSYHLAADFQTVANISEIQPVEHYVTSLHNIEDCDNLVMGCGENKITLWNVEYGYIVATIELSNIKSPLSTLWVKCDRGFLFTIQECVDQELRLIAINGMNHSWKKLQNYNPLHGFDRLKGVCIENGILVAYYSQGILCWNAQTGELIVEEVTNECEYIPSGKHVIMIANDNKIIVRHSLSHLITADEF